MMEIVATNVVASRPPEQRPTATPTLVPIFISEWTPSLTVHWNEFWAPTIHRFPAKKSQFKTWYLVSNSGLGRLLLGKPTIAA